MIVNRVLERLAGVVIHPLTEEELIVAEAILDHIIKQAEDDSSG